MTGIEVQADNSHRIINFELFLPGHQHHGFIIKPDYISEYIDEGQRLSYRGQEYDVTANGGLVHPSVEVPENASLGSGVLVGPNTVFDCYTDPVDGIQRGIKVGERARIEGTHISERVEVGAYAVVLAKRVGRRSTIGRYARLLEGVTVYDDVTIADSAKVKEAATVESGATIQFGAKVGPETYICAGVTVGSNAIVGKRSGDGTRGNNKGGVRIYRDATPRHRPGRLRPAGV